jgi:hypothetical protein
MRKQAQATAEVPQVENDPVQATAARGVEAIGLIVEERNTLRKRCDTLEVALGLREQEVEHYKGLSTKLAHERDHYMRHTVELVTALNSTQALINDAVKQAATRAYAPMVRPPKEPDLPANDVAALERLISKLPNGEANATANPSQAESTSAPPAFLAIRRNGTTPSNDSSGTNS